jgi:hypothetical protein
MSSIPLRDPPPNVKLPVRAQYAWVGSHPVVEKT